jgi:uncharacterized protein (TIGR04141 family)
LTLSQRQSDAGGDMKRAEKPRNRKLSVYLIKEEYQDYSSIIKDGFNGNEVSANGKNIGRLYIKSSFERRPSWLSFFDGIVEKNKLKELSSKSVSGVLLIKRRSRIYAITFGYGRNLLQMGCWEERFGLIVVLNKVSRDKIRIIDRKNLDTMLTHTRSQTSRQCAIEEFGLDVRQVLLQAVTGAPEDEKFGRYISGADALSIVYPATLINLDVKCDELLEAFTSRDYERKFPFVKCMAEVTNKLRIAELNQQMVRKIKSGQYDRLYLAIPDIVEWTNIAGFRFTPKEDSLHYDILIEDFLATVRNLGDLSIEYLKRRKVYQVYADSDLNEEKWSVFHCTNSEIEENGKTYILTEGRWYEIQSSFVAQVNDQIEKVPVSNLEFSPLNKNEKENDYNRRIALNNKAHYYLMDCKLINYGGGNSKIEFCDLFTTDHKIIHVKRYGGSSVLSHLFMQGLNSAKAFIADGQFRAEVNKHLPKGHRFSVLGKPDASKYEVVYGIICGSAGELPMVLPFFSKMTLVNAWIELTTLLGFRMSIFGIKIR